MPERRDSADSFDDFFGVPRTTNNARKSPVEPKKTESSIAALIKRQPTIDRPKSPPEPERHTISSPKTKRKQPFLSQFEILLSFPNSESQSYWHIVYYDHDDDDDEEEQHPRCRYIGEGDSKDRHSVDSRRASECQQLGSIIQRWSRSEEYQSHSTVTSKDAQPNNICSIQSL